MSAYGQVGLMLLGHIVSRMFSLVPQRQNPEVQLIPEPRHLSLMAMMSYSDNCTVGSEVKGCGIIEGVCVHTRARTQYGRTGMRWDEISRTVTEMLTI